MFMLPLRHLEESGVWERDGPDAAASFVSVSTRNYLLLAVPAPGMSQRSGEAGDGLDDRRHISGSAVIMPVVAGALILGGIQW